jgi:plastocyanin
MLGGGLVFSMITDTDNCEPGMGSDITLTIVSKKLEWRYEPEEITLNQCDRVSLTVLNEDNFDHGFAIDAFGVSQRLPANGSIKVNFVASKAGTFPFYCSVSCSDSGASTFNLPDGVVQTGPYTGQFRGHFEHIGQFVVNIFQQLTGSE